MFDDFEFIYLLKQILKQSLIFLLTLVVSFFLIYIIDHFFLGICFFDFLN